MVWGLGGGGLVTNKLVAAVMDHFNAWGAMIEIMPRTKKTQQSRRSMHTRVPRTSQLIKLWDIWLFLKSLVQTDGMNVVADLLLNQHFSLACPSANFWYTMSLSYPLSKERNWRKSFRLTSSNLLPCWWWLGRRWSRTFKHTHNTCKKSY